MNIKIIRNMLLN